MKTQATITYDYYGKKSTIINYYPKSFSQSEILARSKARLSFGQPIEIKIKQGNQQAKNYSYVGSNSWSV